MSALKIADLAFLEKLDDREAKVSGAATAGAAAAADYNDALAASAATTNGYVYARTNGSYYYSGRYYSEDRSHSVYVTASDRYYW